MKMRLLVLALLTMSCVGMVRAEELPKKSFSVQTTWEAPQQWDMRFYVKQNEVSINIRYSYGEGIEDSGSRYRYSEDYTMALNPTTGNVKGWTDFSYQIYFTQMELTRGAHAVAKQIGGRVEAMKAVTTIIEWLEQMKGVEIVQAERQEGGQPVKIEPAEAKQLLEQVIVVLKKDPIFAASGHQLRWTAVDTLGKIWEKFPRFQDKIVPYLSKATLDQDISVVKRAIEILNKQSIPDFYYR